MQLTLRSRSIHRALLLGTLVTALVLAVAPGLASALPSDAASPFSRLAALPGSSVADDSRSVTLGVRFTASTDGLVTGVEFRKGSSANTAREVQLWDATTRTRLATSSRAVLGTGVVHQWFDEPVAVTAGHEYVASYLAPAGRYDAARNVRTTSQTTGPLNAPANAGVYTYGSSATFPASTFQGSDYQVTPVFVAEVDGASPLRRIGLPATSTADSDTRSVTLGVRFTSAANGYVTGVEFRRGSKANTAQAVHLWDATTGAMLATSNRIPSATGTVRQWFDEPVAVVAGRTYVASYLAPTGRYDAVTNARGTAQTSGPLSVPANGGVYSYGTAATMPSRTYAASDYLVTPVFVAGVTAGTTPQPVSPPPTTACSDGLDNDRDGRADHPADPGCNTAGDNDEADPTVTAPAAPTGSTLRGWQLDAKNVGLAPFGLSCDSLPAYTGSLKPPAGARISGVRITGVLDLSNGDIQVTKSCIRPTRGDNRNLVFNDNWATGGGEVTSPRSVLIADSEFDGSLAPASEIARSCAFRGVGVLQRNYIHGMGSGICFFGTGNVHDAVAEQNYVTGLRADGDSHNEAATIRDFVPNGPNTRVARFSNNRLDCRTGNDTGALFIQPTWEDIRNVRIEGNYLEGAGYNLYIENSGGVYGNVHATDNRFRPTSWGPVAVNSGVGWATWADNFRFDPNAPDGRGTAISQP
ncbi:DUF4082 domain-containing protein [Geodermatophilus sp. SYSU D00766]